jgi:hypothetical protein
VANIVIGFRDLALFVIHKQGGSTVLFPAPGHAKRIMATDVWDGQELASLDSSPFELRILENGKDLLLAPVAPPTGGNSVDLGNLATGGHVPTLKSTAVALNGNMFLAGGRLADPKSAVLNSTFANTTWNFGTWQGRLTERMDFSLPANPASSYTLEWGSGSLSLVPDHQVYIFNGDRNAHPNGPVIELPEFASITRLAGLGDVIPRREIPHVTMEAPPPTYDDRPCPNAFMVES